MRKTLVQTWAPVDVAEFFDRLAEKQNHSMSGVVCKVLMDYKARAERRAKRSKRTA
jgi:hypothetical protein